MDILLYILIAAAVLAAAVLIIAYVCFRMAFFVKEKVLVDAEHFSLPPGDVYEPYRDTMKKWMIETEKLPFERLSVTSHDGLTLCGKYFEYAPGAPIELMFHGYRGSAERDLCGGVQRCFALGRSALIVDQRASGRSDGRVISFGINESRDCVAWVHKMIERFGNDVKIIITGISMGAATVMMAAAEELPSNVIGALADCGYNSARDIIKKTIREMKLPPSLAYPFVRLGAIVYGGFDPDSNSPEKAMKKCRLPIIFIHGEADDYVPCEMSRINYEACTAPKVLMTVPGAGHGISYLADGDGYLRTLADFSSEYITPTKIVAGK